MALAPRNSSQGHPRWDGGSNRKRATGPSTQFMALGINSSRFGSRAACGKSTPGVRLLPGFSHSELVIAALTPVVSLLHMLQPPWLHRGRKEKGEEHTCSRAQLGVLDGKPATLLSHHTSQLPARLELWGCHPPTMGMFGSLMPLAIRHYMHQGLR